MAYGTPEGVAALKPAIGVLSTETTPTEVQVDTWLEAASAMINAALAGAGYAINVDESAAYYPVLVGMAQDYAAAKAIQARGLDTLSGGDESTSEQMLDRFYDDLKRIGSFNLEPLGVTVLVSTSTRPRQRLRTVSIRRTDGYSAVYEGSATQYEYPSE